MGESADELDETFDFRSQVSSLDNPTEDYFAPISNHFCVGDIVTTASKHDLDQFMTRFIFFFTVFFVAKDHELWNLLRNLHAMFYWKMKTYLLNELKKNFTIS